MQQNTEALLADPDASVVMRFTEDFGANWTPSLLTDPRLLHSYPQQTDQQDPTVSVNPATGDFYFLWQPTSDLNQVDHKRTDYTMALPSTPDTILDPSYEVNDRPWSWASAGRAYLSYASVVPGAGKSFRMTFGDVNGTAVNWGGDATQWYTSPGNVSAEVSAPIAVGRQSLGYDIVFGLVLQRVVGSPLDSNNQLRVFRSTTGGKYFDSGYTITSYGDTDAGWNSSHELGMFDYNIVADHASGNVWVFYAKTYLDEPQVGNPPPPRLKYQILFARHSSDDGATWAAPEIVVNGQQWAAPPTYTYATFANGDAGHLRFGRVAACIGADGNAHCCYFANREGQYTAQRDKWNVYWSRKDGLAWTMERLSSDDSIGGYGNPFNHNLMHYPPGDCLSCDVDATNRYAAWPDTRDFEANPATARTKAYFRKF